MYNQIHNHATGSCLSGLIKRKFKSAQRFFKTCLQTSGVTKPTGEEKKEETV